MEGPHRIDEASALQGWPLGHATHAVVCGQATASLLGGKPLPLQEQEAPMLCCFTGLPWRLRGHGQAFCSSPPHQNIRVHL